MFVLIIIYNSVITFLLFSLSLPRLQIASNIFKQFINQIIQNNTKS